MDDLISRQYVIGLIRSMYPSSPILPSNRRKWEEKYEPFIRVEREISNLPSAQQEIVRCGDCKNHEWCSIEDTALNDETFFCKWGERRQDG